MVARLAGTNVEEGERLINESGLPVIRAADRGGGDEGGRRREGGVTRLIVGQVEIPRDQGDHNGLTDASSSSCTDTMTNTLCAEHTGELRQMVSPDC